MQDMQAAGLFQSTLPRGSDILTCGALKNEGNFNPRSLAGATIRRFLSRRCKYDFNPRSLAGATIFLTSCKQVRELFQSTLPRGSDGSIDDKTGVITSISIHAPSRERRLVFEHFQRMCGISIHAPSRERHIDLWCSEK